MTREEKKLAREFIFKYNKIYGQIDSIHKRIEDLKKEMSHLQNELSDTRGDEQLFINNLRLIYGTEKINANYLLESLKEEIV